MKDRFTFIINTYPSKDRQKQLIKTLNSIYLQSYKDFEILLIENFIDLSKILKIIKKYSRKQQIIKVIYDPTKKLSYLFNLGWRNSQTENIAYVADDVTLDKDWLKNAKEELLNHKKGVIITGPIISNCYPAGEMHRLYLLSQKNIFMKFLSWPYLYFCMEKNILAPGKLFESGAYSLGSSIRQSLKYEKQEIDLATTSSMVLTKTILKKLNGFDERFSFNHADGDLFIRAKAKGYKVIFDPNVRSIHNLRIGPSRNAYIIGIDTARFYKKNIKPKTLKGIIGMIINILFLNCYWLYSSIRLKSPGQLTGIFGFIKGIFGR
ncbi:hypothetical protein A2V49_02290 [candidate division WWE3 bacterium RBG_19FT_COMBO_34_6]|uniref:Glycosyltransferase 2-like domain-containing protein n=1 Tax=candidate division WWE3 bacterium RBG_19FT_COMBO_34_6 TaxID=1802612 RepID=A0A1F4UJX1_UNCKA|nr:MAG: hypothetical protein A2V49_02290 [candidate division WWE3 bacterium RBG_19FT_COMBO_34_6]